LQSPRWRRDPRRLVHFPVYLLRLDMFRLPFEVSFCLFAAGERCMQRESGQQRGHEHHILQFRGVDTKHQCLRSDLVSVFYPNTSLLENIKNKETNNSLSAPSSLATTGCTNLYFDPGTYCNLHAGTETHQLSSTSSYYFYDASCFECASPSCTTNSQGLAVPQPSGAVCDVAAYSSGGTTLVSYSSGEPITSLKACSAEWYPFPPFFVFLWGYHHILSHQNTNMESIIVWQPRRVQIYIIRPGSTAICTLAPTRTTWMPHPLISSTTPAASSAEVE
jgi:hypothetical protein